ncbi:MAG: hypothetical protein ACRDYA_19375 [Egibacteraceae bacterium]
MNDLVAAASLVIEAVTADQANVARAAYILAATGTQDNAGD